MVVCGQRVAGRPNDSSFLLQKQTKTNNKTKQTRKQTIALAFSYGQASLQLSFPSRVSMPIVSENLPVSSQPKEGSKLLFSHISPK